MYFVNRQGKFLKDERGGILILVAVIMVVLLGATALAVDAGALYQTRRQMVNAADAAALAGAQEFYYDSNWGNVKTYAENYAINNYGCDPDLVWAEQVGNNGVKVTTGKNVEYAFARFLNLTDTDVTATATAVFAAVAEGNIIPIGMNESFLAAISIGLEEDFVYFEDNHFGPGNWSWVYFTQTENWKKTHEYLEYGYDAKVGDPIWTNTGANIVAGQQKESEVRRILDYYIENEIELAIPIMAYDAPGTSAEKWTGKTPAVITGFALVILTDYDFDGPTSTQAISGKLLKRLEADEIADIENGSSLKISGVALVD